MWKPVADKAVVNGPASDNVNPVADQAVVEDAAEDVSAVEPAVGEEEPQSPVNDTKAQELAEVEPAAQDQGGAQG